MDQNGRTAVPRSLSFQERREAAVRELLRLLRPGGQALIYVWALEQKGTQEDDGPSKYIKPVKNNFSQTCLPQDGQGDSGMPLPVHINRTDFEAHDMLVPWHSRDTGEVHYRHVSFCSRRCASRRDILWQCFADTFLECFLDISLDVSSVYK